MQILKPLLVSKFIGTFYRRTHFINIGQYFTTMQGCLDGVEVVWDSVTLLPRVQSQPVTIIFFIFLFSSSQSSSYPIMFLIYLMHEFYILI
jgi:hypothetical protein